MIEAFSLRTAHKFGDALASQARLRHKVFIEQRRLEHLSYDGLEYDEFDTPGAVYFVWRDEDRIVRGLLRLLPTTIPYMLQTYWPNLVQNGVLPRSPKVREVTRICVDKGFDPQIRIRLFPALLAALQEYCALHNVEAVIGVTRPHLINHFIRKGVTWLGTPALVEGAMEAAFLVPLERMRPEHHCRKLGLAGPMLSLEPLGTDSRIAA